MSSISSHNDVQSRDDIQTFVFFDLETTGLIQGSRMPKITEISLVASSRLSLYTKNGSLPRVMHKLIIPLQPFRPIPLEVSQLTGLYNDLLENEKPFDDEAYQLLNSFISRLCPPVCFVAHNGIKFDYPILLSALNCIGKTLSKDILCIDSLAAFKTLLFIAESNDGKNISKSKPVNKEWEMIDEGWDEVLAAIVDDHSSSSMSVKMTGTEVTGGKYETNQQSMQKVNETTPTHQIIRSLNINHNQIGGLPAKKRLPFTHSRPVNFKLTTVYQHLVGAPPLNSHSAESDCLCLLICAMKLGESFIHWADQNARPLAASAINQQ